MQENDGAVVGVIDHRIFHGGSVAVLPVLGIHGPVDQRSAHQTAHPGIGAAVRGPNHVHRTFPRRFAQQVIGLADLAAHAAIRQASEVRMVITVIGQLVALPVHPGYRIRVAGHVTAHHKKCSLDPSLGKAVQQAVGIWARAIVKGDGHQLTAGGPNRGNGRCQAQRNGQSQQGRENAFHERHLFPRFSPS